MGVDFLVVIFHALYIEDFAGSTPGSVLHTHTLKLNEKLSISPAYMQEFLFFSHYFVRRARPHKSNCVGRAAALLLWA